MPRTPKLIRFRRLAVALRAVQRKRLPGTPPFRASRAKGTRDYLELRTSEAEKVRCGKKHFEAIGVSFDVAVTAGEV